MPRESQMHPFDVVAVYHDLVDVWKAYNRHVSPYETVMLRTRLLTEKFTPDPGVPL